MHKFDIKTPTRNKDEQRQTGHYRAAVTYLGCITDFEGDYDFGPYAMVTETIRSYLESKLQVVIETEEKPV